MQPWGDEGRNMYEGIYASAPQRVPGNVAPPRGNPPSGSGGAYLPSSAPHNYNASSTSEPPRQETASGQGRQRGWRPSASVEAPPYPPSYHVPGR